MKISDFIDKEKYSLDEAHRLVTLLVKKKGWKSISKLRTFLTYVPEWRERIHIEGSGNGARYEIPAEVLADMIYKIKNKKIK